MIAMYLVKKLGDWAIKKNVQSANKLEIEIILGLCNALEEDLRRIDPIGEIIPEKTRSGIRRVCRKVRKYKKLNAEKVKHAPKIQTKLEPLLYSAVLFHGSIVFRLSSHLAECEIKS